MNKLNFDSASTKHIEEIRKQIERDRSKSLKQFQSETIEFGNMLLTEMQKPDVKFPLTVNIPDLYFRTSDHYSIEYDHTIELRKFLNSSITDFDSIMDFDLCTESTIPAMPHVPMVPYVQIFFLDSVRPEIIESAIPECLHMGKKEKKKSYWNTWALS
jgi:hypothetical protein